MTATEPDALERAAQAVISAAVALDKDIYYDGNCWVPENSADVLRAAVDAFRAAGGKTIEEHVADAVVPVDFSYAPWA